MTDETRATIERANAPNYARAGLLIDALNALLDKMEPIISRDFGAAVELSMLVKPKGDGDGQDR